MMSVKHGLLSSVSNMTIRILRSRFKHFPLMILSSKLLLMTGATIAKNTTLYSKMNLFSLNTSLEVGISASATSGRKIKDTTKVTIP